MNHYNVPRVMAAGLALSLLSACALFHKKPAPAPAPMTSAPVAATVAAPAVATQAPAPAMQPTAPERYTVKKGDTLWSIASMYLKDAWAWPDIWYANPGIKNPHLIFPGDVLILSHNPQGQPMLSVERNGRPADENSPPPQANPGVLLTNVPTASSQAPAVTAPEAQPVAIAAAAPSASALPVTKLSPQPRYLPLDAAVTTVPLGALRAFLSKTRIMTQDEMDNSAHLVTAFNLGPVSGAGDEVYARGLNNKEGSRYEIFRKGDKYVDPDSGSALGYEATYIGDAQVEAWSDPAKLLVTASEQEAREGDLFVPSNGDVMPLNFFPHHPVKTIDGQIAAVLGGVGQIGQFYVVLLNRGTDQGVDQGTVLGIYRKGDTVKDKNAGFFSWTNVTLPTEHTGTLMVFRAFKDSSYALVMEASHEVHVADLVGNP
jgi:LysM repeat protein